jgi:hypothetical protein
MDLKQLGIKGLGNATDISTLNEEELTTIVDGLAELYTKEADNQKELQ